jgi:hypothetical protein
VTGLHTWNITLKLKYIYLMKKIILSSTIAIILLFPSGKSVFGLGISLIRQDSAVGMPAMQPSYSSPFYLLINRLGGIDIVVDTAVAKNQLFNYRLSLECYNTSEKKDYLIYNYSYNLNRLVLASTFGFGFIRTRFVRLWAGPQLAFSYEFMNRSSSILNSVVYNKIGAVVGVNFHTGEETTLGFELGFRTGLGFDLNKSILQTILNAKPEPIVSIKLIFRSWDTFVPSVL